MNKAIEKAVHTLDELLKQFAEYYGKSIQMLIAAAKCYNEAITTYGDEAENVFSAGFPQLSGKDWLMLLRIARREISPKLFVMTSASIVNKISTLPYNTQVEILGDTDTPAKPLPVLSHGKILTKTVPEMNAVEISSLIDGNGRRIRTSEEQINRMNKKTAQETQEKQKWEVTSTGVIIYTPCFISRDDISKIMDQFKGV